MSLLQVNLVVMWWIVTFYRLVKHDTRGKLNFFFIQLIQIHYRHVAHTRFFIKICIKVCDNDGQKKKKSFTVIIKSTDISI